MLLGELLADRSLGLTPLTENPPGDRAVQGVYVTDLLDPRRYLHGGELVLSGLMWWTGRESSEDFVAALADAGVAALAAGTARLGEAPADLVEACALYGVPAVQVPLTVSFNALAERVRARSAPRREFMSAVAAGADLDHVLAMAAADLGTDCWVLSGVGALVGGSTELPEPVRVGLLDELARYDEPSRTVRVAGGHEFLLWPVDTDAWQRPSRWWVLVRVGPGWSEEREAVVADVATVVALVRGRIDEARRIAGRSVESALRQLLDGGATAGEAAAWLQSAGLPVGESLRAVSLVAGDARTSVSLLRELVAATGMPAVSAPLAEGAVALFADAETELSGLDESLRGLVAQSHALWRGSELALGISDIGSAKGVRAVVEEAGHARRLASTRARLGRPGSVASAAELDTHDVLLAALPDELRGSYRRRLLASVIAYDAEHRSELVRTLHVFLDCSGSWSRCAEQLHVHVNTLRYRIRRVEEITGRDLGEFSTRVDFYLALRLERSVS